MAVTEAEWAAGRWGANIAKLFDRFDFGEAFIRRHSTSAKQQNNAMLWFIRMATERDW